MKAIYNGEILDLESISIPSDDRGFRYGDGLFETIVVVKSAPRFLDKHYARLQKGAQIFGFDIHQLPFDQIKDDCKKLIRVNEIEEYGKIRLSIWRKGKGLYQPQNKALNYSITITPIESLATREVHLVDFSEKTINFPTIYSPFKTMSALKYVLAGLEKKEKGLEEIIIKDFNGNVSESLDSNIFIRKNGSYATPPVSTGCIEGVMRNWLIETLESKNIPVDEIGFNPNEMMKAEAIFTTNALGIKHILKIGNTEFRKDDLIQEIIDSIS